MMLKLLSFVQALNLNHLCEFSFDPPGTKLLSAHQLVTLFDALFDALFASAFQGAAVSQSPSHFWPTFDRKRRSDSRHCRPKADVVINVKNPTENLTSHDGKYLRHFLIKRFSGFSEADDSSRP